MSGWREVELGDVATVSWGDTSTTKASYVDGGYLAFSATGPDGFLPHADHHEDGVVISAIGAQCGKTWYAKGDWSCIKNTMWFRAKPGADTRFLYYATANPAMWPRRGAAQPFIALGDAKVMRFPLPPMPAQRRIAAVLSVIDELIENNRRRIEVLEEMARAIYREWFVRFRFPGHENVELIDSDLGPIPEGWVVRTVGDVLALKYGKALKADARAGGDVAVVGSSGIVGWHDLELIRGPAIIVGRKGNVGSVIWVDGPSWPIDTTYFVESDWPLRFVAEQLRRTEFLNTHAAVPGLSREQAYSRPFLQPPPQLVDQFQSVGDSLAREGSALTRQSEHLAALRDLLLPKLVTGQIDVSSLDLDALLEGAVA